MDAVEATDCCVPLLPPPHAPTPAPGVDGVEPAPGVAPTPELAAELLAFAREHLAHYMAPRSLDFIEEMPRLPTGKLYKRLLKDKYWEGRAI